MKRRKPRDVVYYMAQREHAWLLRAEGLTFGEIGLRLGVPQGTARGMVRSYGRRVARAMRHTKIRKVDEPA
jgi:DNA-directed RNA polymerase specialized sigma24 family protein